MPRETGGCHESRKKSSLISRLASTWPNSELPWSNISCTFFFSPVCKSGSQPCGGRGIPPGQILNCKPTQEADSSEKVWQAAPGPWEHLERSSG